jgi:isopentenyl-diphosphate delta-isomerase
MIMKRSKIPVVSSGGLRTGMDVAKSLVMGASLTAMALPVLRPATKSPEDVKKFINNVIMELKSVMFLLGAKNIKELARVPYVATGELAIWKDYADKTL